jgi:hypothetical protein
MDPYTLEFFLVSTGEVLGRVVWNGHTLAADAAVNSMVGNRDPEEFLQTYDGWSNGYVSARRPGEDRATVPSGGVKLIAAVDRDAAVKEHFETEHIVDPETGEDWDPKAPPPDLTPDDAEA